MRGGLCRTKWVARHTSLLCHGFVNWRILGAIFNLTRFRELRGVGRKNNLT